MGKHKHLLSLFSMLTLLLGMAVPAGAGALDLDLAAAVGSDEFGLRLAEAAGARDVEAPLEGPLLARAQEAPFLELHPTTVRDSWSGMQNTVQTSPAEGGSKKRGAGRWLKKYWWVPALAAVAIGLAVDDGDTDATGEED